MLKETQLYFGEPRKSWKWAVCWRCSRCCTWSRREWTDADGILTVECPPDVASLEQRRRQASSMDSRLGRRWIQEANKRLKHSALKTWMTSACFSREIGFIDNFSNAWNFRGHFKPDWFDPDCQPPSCPWKQEHDDPRITERTGMQPFISHGPLLHITQGMGVIVPLQDPASPPTPPSPS